MARWNFDPLLIFALLCLGVAIHLYRSDIRVRPATAALAVIAFLYISPFCPLGSALFTVRIVHDVILAAVLAPLIVAALRLEKQRLAGSIWAWTAIHALTFWLWHAPPFYKAAMSSDATFWAMQVSITGASVIWWTKVIRAPAPAAVSTLLATMIAMGALGALLAFTNRALYAPHWLTTQTWGLSPLEDQQIAGIVMWAPASLVYLLAALAVLYRALGEKAPA